MVLTKFDEQSKQRSLATGIIIHDPFFPTLTVELGRVNMHPTKIEIIQLSLT